MTSKKRRRHTPDQIIRKLAEGNKLLAAGRELDEVCRHLEIAESTWHRWVELLNAWRFDSLLEACVIIEDWRRDYNANRPHTAHDELTPTEFALQWTTTHRPQVA